MVVAEQKKEEKDTQNTQKAEKQRMKTDKKIADFWPFLALFQGKLNSVLSYVVRTFLIRLSSFRCSHRRDQHTASNVSLVGSRRQQNKGVHGTICEHKKKQSSLP